MPAWGRKWWREGGGHRGCASEREREKGEGVFERGSPAGVETGNVVESWIYQLDVAVVIALVAGVLGGALALRRRANEGLRDFSSAGLLVVAFLLLHLWGQFRPVPVMVESFRPMTEAEKIPMIKRGIPAEMLENMNVTNYRRFDGSNARDWSWGEVNRMKGRLA